MKLVGIGITNFRSIGSSPVYIDLEKKVSILIGANNSGKSNVIKALLWLAEHGRNPPKNIDQLDQHMQAGANQPGYAFEVVIEVDDQAGIKPGSRARFCAQVKDRRFTCEATPFDEMCWNVFSEVRSHYTNNFYSGQPLDEVQKSEKVKLAENMVENLISHLPKMYLVPQFRQIREGEYSLDGAGIIGTLASWQRPGPGKQEDKARFRQIQNLVRHLLHAPEIELDVDHEKKHIMVTRNGLRLPLESYGTGIHELIILATALYSQENALFCIEEPEIHLHPRLQKELLNFLLTQTNNRYVLTTHSHALLTPSDEVQVTHLRSVSGVTEAWQVDATEDAMRVLDDLGVRASDILQANYVIWVEGPSDRAYIKRWLQLLADDLREGIEYSVMFYGGRLLSHLSLGREDSGETASSAAEQLIPLLRLNQHAAVVMDSDCKKKEAALNASKTRVQEECQRSKSHCWVTHGREIENYLAPRAVACAYKEKTGEEPAELKVRRYDTLERALKRAYKDKWKNGFSYNGAKADWARLIAKQTNLDDLEQQLCTDLEPIILAIRAANQ